MPKANRRTFLAGSAALPVALKARVPATLQEGAAADLKTYIGFGNKQTGGAGDNACGAWIASELQRAGFTVSQQTFEAPFFEARHCSLRCGDAAAEVWPQPIVVPTGPEGASGPLVRIDPYGRPDAPLAGAIALFDLPSGRWSSTSTKAIREPVAAAFSAGAKAVVVITNGPTGKLIALNADGHRPMFAGPVAILAPDNAKPFLAAAADRAPATLVIQGNGGRRPAFNVSGQLERGKSRWLVVSTPRSGWFTCAAERGSGLAVWLWLARWASRSVRNYNLAFVCNSGHEYEYLGASEGLKTFRPKPEDTHFWLHLGANVAGRDWHEGVGQLRPLPSVDPQRFLSVSPRWLNATREVFSGHPGYEAPYSSDVLSAGELNEIMAAGYKSAAGVFGAHRFHHTPEDEAQCLNAANVVTTATAFQRLLENIVA